MSAARKHFAKNEQVIEAHERKVLKEEQKRLERMAVVKVATKRPAGGKINLAAQYGNMRLVDLQWSDSDLPFKEAV